MPFSMPNANALVGCFCALMLKYNIFSHTILNIDALIHDHLAKKRKNNKKKKRMLLYYCIGIEAKDKQTKKRYKWVRTKRSL